MGFQISEIKGIWRGSKANAASWWFPFCLGRKSRGYSMGLLNRWPAKRAQKVKGTHTVSLEREKSIYVSSALNAYQAIDILLKNLIKQKAADKTESNEGYYLAGGLSHNVSGITVRVIESVVTWRWNYAACFISTIPSFTLLCS